MKNILKSIIIVTVISVCQVYSYGQNVNFSKNKSSIKKNDKSLLSSSLQKIAAMTENNSNTAKLTSEFMIRHNKVLIVARCTNSDQLLLKNELESIGLEKVKIYGSVVNGWLPIANITKMESCKYLRKVTPEKRPHTKLGVVTNEAEIVMNSKEAKRVFGVDGTGIKIGILSDTFDAQGNYEQSVLNGDLPGPGNPNGFTKPVVILSDLRNNDDDDFQFADEGRAMAELIHDIAPGAELYFHTAIDGTFDFADGIRELAAAGCTIIVDDIFDFNSPFFQVGVIAQAVNDVKQDGVTYFSAIGNDGSNGYLNDFKSIKSPSLENPFPERPFELMDFGNATESLVFEVPKGGSFSLELNWSDPSIFSGNDNVELKSDLEIYIYDENGNSVYAADTNNLEEGKPSESYNLFLGKNQGPIKLQVAINKFSGINPRKVHILTSGNASLLNFPAFTGPTCYGQPNAEGAIAVGASWYLDSPEFGFANYLVEPTSSVGGLPILINENNEHINPIIRQKPELVGADGVNNTFFGEGDEDNDGFPNFFGTSAAAPNVAAIAALMLELKPSLTPDEIKQTLINTAIDMDDPSTVEFDKGFDFKTGYGFVLADAALASIADRPSVYRYELVDAGTGEFIQALRDGDSIDISRIAGGARFNVVAIATNKKGPLKRLTLELQGRQNQFRIDKSFPYTLRKEFTAWNAKNGNYSIIGQSFSNLKNSKKNKVNFTIYNSSFVQGFSLVDNDNPNLIRSSISNNDKTLAILSNNSPEEISNLNIKPELAFAGNDFFESLEAEEVFYRVYGPNTSYVNRSSVPNFLAFVNTDGIAVPWSPAPVSGNYTLEATPLARVGDMDTAGRTMRFKFKVKVPNVKDSGEKLLANTGNKKMRIFPNPSTGIINLESLHNETLLGITVYNTAGARVYSNTNNLLETTKINIDLSDVSKGLYFVKANYANKIEVVRKVVIE